MTKARFFLAICILTSGCISLSSTQRVDAKVTKVVDGDTIFIEFDNKTREVRFEGIDTPEVNTETKPYAFEGVPSSEAGRNCLRKYGEKASGFVKEKISGSNITLSYETGLLGKEKGAYDRLIGRIFYSGKNVSLNHLLVKKGLARSYTENGPFFPEEIDAKLEMRGVWNCQKVS